MHIKTSKVIEKQKELIPRSNLIWTEIVHKVPNKML